MRQVHDVLRGAAWGNPDPAAFGPALERLGAGLLRHPLAAAGATLRPDALRANDLVGSCVGGNWLMGERPPAFDILGAQSDHIRRGRPRTPPPLGSDAYPALAEAPGSYMHG